MKWRRLLSATMLLFGLAITAGPPARADIYAYPCQYPGVGFGGEVLGIGGQFCDYPTEINGSHWHCESGGAKLGGLGLASQNGISLGALGSIGASGEGCSFRCPDMTVAPAPNPPGMWKEYVVPRLNFCRDHQIPAGPTSELVHPDEGAKPPPPGAIPEPVPDDPQQIPPRPPAAAVQQPPDFEEGEGLPLPPGLPSIPKLPLPPLP